MCWRFLFTATYILPYFRPHFTFCNTLCFAAPPKFYHITLHFAALYILQQLYIVPLHFTFCSTLRFVVQQRKHTLILVLTCSLYRSMLSFVNGTQCWKHMRVWDIFHSNFQVFNEYSIILLKLNLPTIYTAHRMYHKVHKYNNIDQTGSNNKVG